jgi:hypothetical protein
MPGSLSRKVSKPFQNPFSWKKENFYEQDLKGKEVIGGLSSVLTLRQTNTGKVWSHPELVKTQQASSEFC